MSKCLQPPRMPGLGLNDRETAALADVLAYRERDEREVEIGAVEVFADALSQYRWADKVSADAYELIVQHETGGRAYYETVYRGHPVWPGEASGVTIGFGYDLGRVLQQKFRHDWAVLGPSLLDRFIENGAIGARGNAARAIIAALRDIVISWETAERVFRSITLPEWAEKTALALPNCDALNDDCFGALVSLTFNRGANYSGGGDRREEMRAIQTAMANRDFSQIPDLLRRMTRVWRGTSIETEMRRRRNNEADLFKRGLAASIRMGQEIPKAASVSQLTTLAQADTEFELTEEEEVTRSYSLRGTGDEVLEAAAIAAVLWPSDCIAPDYAHLPPSSTVGLTFTLCSQDLELLATLNAFPVDEAGAVPILFGLRGCQIVGSGWEGSQDWQEEVLLKDIRPNHTDTRCVIGAWDRLRNRIAVFPGSTVPNAGAVTTWFDRKTIGNLLPTGLYRYIVGVHRGKPGCFVLRKGDGSPRTVIVRRSSNNRYYDLADLFTTSEPLDNLHPTFGRSEHTFSSAGCQTVLGMTDIYGNHSGPWARFRAIAGQTTPGGVPNSPYLYMLLTGREAYLAADLRRKELASDNASLRALRRLRFGSKGAQVSLLQKALGAVTADGDFGPETSRLLHQKQRTIAEGKSDGIYSSALDATLGWALFSAPIVT